MTKQLAVRKPETGLRNLDRFLGDMFEDIMGSWSPFDDFVSISPYRSEVTKTDKEYNIEVALPGASREGISVSAHKGILSISYQTKNVSENRFSSRSFDKRWTLPTGTKEEDVQAEYKDGILKVVIPIGESPPEEAPIKIEIK